MVPSIHTLRLNITIGGKEENCTFECCVKFWLEWSSISNCGWFRHYMLFDATIVIRVHVNPDLLHHQLFNELWFSWKACFTQTNAALIFYITIQIGQWSSLEFIHLIVLHICVFVFELQPQHAPPQQFCGTSFVCLSIFGCPPWWALATAWSNQLTNTYQCTIIVIVIIILSSSSQGQCWPTAG